MSVQQGITVLWELNFQISSPAQQAHTTLMSTSHPVLWLAYLVVLVITASLVPVNQLSVRRVITVPVALAQEHSLLVMLELIMMCLDLRITPSVRLALLGHIVQMVH